MNIFEKFMLPHKNIKGSTLDRFKIMCDSTNHSLLAKKLNNTLEVDKIYFKLDSNLHVLRETTNFAHILL